MRPHLRASAMVLAAICAGIAARAQRDSQPAVGLSSIQGRVVLQDSPNQPLEQVPVQLSQSNGIPITVVYTSGNGQFLFTNLSTGGYEVSVSLQGYERFSQKVSITTASGRIQMQIHLRKLEPRAQTGPGSPSVSVSEMMAPAGARRDYEKGLEKLRKNDTVAAERLFKKAVAVHPAFSRAWVELGQLYAGTSRPKEALESFRQALRHDGKNREALLCLARLMNDRGQYVEALRAAAQLEQITAGDARNHLEIARGLLGVGKLKEAEWAAREIERGPHPQIPEVHLVLFNIIQLRGEKPAAASELRIYLKEMEETGVALNNPAIIRARDLLTKLETEIAAAK